MTDTSQPPSDPENDEERIAALLDGRLDSRQREEMLSRLAGNDADYDVFAASASILRELDDDAAATGQVPTADGDDEDGEAVPTSA